MKAADRPSGPLTRRGRAISWFGQGADNPDLDAMLKDTNTEWSAAILRSSSAAGLELSTDTAVMAIGGFSGSDPVPTLSQFQDDVAQHKVAYYIVMNNRGHGPGWGNRGHADIGKWVAATFSVDERRAMPRCTTCRRRSSRAPGDKPAPLVGVVGIGGHRQHPAGG